jgi:hypothetical protein
MICAHLNESEVNSKVLDGAIGQVDARVVLGERTKKRSVTRKESNLSPFKRSCDDLRAFSGEKNSLG